MSQTGWMKHRRLGAVVTMLVSSAAAAAWAQASEAPEHLAEPPESEPIVLEIGAGLARPEPIGGIPAPREPESAETPFTTTVVATTEDTAGIVLSLDGSLGPVLRSVIATDLAYVSELRLDASDGYLVEGTGASANGETTIELALRHADGSPGVLRSSYRGPDTGAAAFLHEWVDDVVEKLTGVRSAFRSRLVFSRRLGPRRKAIFVVDADGGNLHMVSGDQGIAMLPSFGADAIWYSLVTTSGVFITRTGVGERFIIGTPGTNMGAQECHGRLFFAATRDGNTDIWSAALDGTDEQRLTREDAIDVSPTCLPDGRIAFVSDRGGRPQLWALRPGRGQPRQLSRTDTESQTPAVCPDPHRSMLAYTEVGHGMRIMTLDLASGETHRVSPARGIHKDPAFSPDCRMLAWVSPEGVVVATVDGRLVRTIARGHAETVRWGR